MKDNLDLLWAKSAKGEAGSWQPLVLHLVDVAACADVILEREPESTRDRMGAILGLTWDEGRPWILLLIACHDLGKACPSFQAKWQDRPSVELRHPRQIDHGVNHGFVSQLSLQSILEELGWPTSLAELASDAVGCHHGSRASERDKRSATREIEIGRGEHTAAIRADWDYARRRVCDELFGVLNPGVTPTKSAMSGPDFMLLAGLTSFADWIGSNETWFNFGTPADCDDLGGWFTRRLETAASALDAIGWLDRRPLSLVPRDFLEVFKRAPRPLQQAMAGVVGQLEAPAVVLLEAPMGEGKTEAAFLAHLELQRRFGHRGMYVALPTRATGNAMYDRTLKFLESQGAHRCLDLQLLHGSKLLNDTFKSVRLTQVYDSTEGGAVRASEWFTNKKRALLSEYGVGTVDQALVPILPVRHNFVRLWGLANRVIVFDEIHAYDDYTGTLLVDLLQWLNALGSSIILLSATLSPSIRRKLAGAVGADLPQHEAAYPRISVLRSGEVVEQRHFDTDAARRLAVTVCGIGADVSDLQAALQAQLPLRGAALGLVNTVQRAQELYESFGAGEPIECDGELVGKRLADGTEILLFHARYPAAGRQRRETLALTTFGPEAIRQGRQILIATQVAEQSLDLDFDLMATDLAPIDLLLQRAGRLWRRADRERSMSSPTLFVAGLVGSEPPSFLQPLWWGKVYREDFLLRTWCLLRSRDRITLPDDIDDLVEAVYEEGFTIPASLDERMAAALAQSEGAAIGKRQQAHMAVIGFPDDASWNDPSRYVLYDEDAAGVHRTLMAQTRLGRDSAVTIPLHAEDELHAHETPTPPRAAEWLMRGVVLSRPRVVRRLFAMGVPEGWKDSALLRNCYPLRLDAAGRWVEDPTVRLDRELGLVYESEGM
jgi:CRISPR-associated endonuclease/helicase Cas3